MADEPTSTGQREVIVDTGRCRVERHPEHGVIIIGELSGAIADGKAAFVPAR